MLYYKTFLCQHMNVIGENEFLEDLKNHHDIKNNRAEMAECMKLILYVNNSTSFPLSPKIKRRFDFIREMANFRFFCVARVLIQVNCSTYRWISDVN